MMLRPAKVNCCFVKIAILTYRRHHQHHQRPPVVCCCNRTRGDECACWFLMTRALSCLRLPLGVEKTRKVDGRT